MLGGIRNAVSKNPIAVGLIIGAAGLVILALLVTAVTAMSYEGYCGGLLPFMGERSECGLWDYMRVWLPFNFAVLFSVYRYAVAAILLLPALILWAYRGRVVRRSAGIKP